MEIQQLRPLIKTMLFDAGLDGSEIDVEVVCGGGNNKVFAIQAQDNKYLAKAYFSNPADKRDRLGNEYAFLSYALSINISCVPKSIFSNSVEKIALYEFVEGRKLVSTELTPLHVMKAACFINELNAKANGNTGSSEQALQLPVASEACFSVDQHFSLIDRRINILKNLPVDSNVDHEALAFVAELDTVWQQLKNEILTESESVVTELTQEDRCISPSDFGFHNALLRNTGDICFIDFEYAGWDDPAKMIGDFFSQPEVPVSLEYFDDFVNQALSYTPNKEILTARAHLLLPLFQIKWCCIILNEFLPVAAKRRRFANPVTEIEQRKTLQLEKAQKLFNSIQSRCESWHT
jgi:hypothetical protein